MEGFLNVLKTLASTFESHISSVSVRVQTPRLTLGSLPGEILLEIINYEGMGLSKEDMTHRDLGLKTLLRYSHICSRLRDFIFSLHSLWALVPLGLDIPAHIIEMIARGSGTLGLIVTVDARWKEPYVSSARSESSESTNSDASECKTLRSVHVQLALDAIFKYRSRWDDVHFVVNDQQSAHYIQDHPSSTTLVSNSIRTLTISGAGGRQGTHFCHNWTMPHLENLDWKNGDILPLPFCPSTSTLRLSSCSFGLARPKLVDIVAFLSATPTMTSLNLELGTEPDFDEPIKNQVANLPNLEYLELDTGNFSTSAIVRFLAAILCPGLKHLSFLTHRHETYLNLAGHMQERYPILSSLTLYTYWRNERGLPEAAIFEDILCTLPSTIQKIVLRGGGKVEICSPSRIDAIARPRICTCYPHLKELSLMGCYMPLEDSLYISFSNILRKYGVILDHLQPFWYQGHTRSRGHMTVDERNNVLSIMHSAGVLNLMGNTNYVL